MTKNIKITLHNSSISDLKKNIIFFWSFLRKNISTKWKSGHRPFVDYFSWKKPPTFCLMNMICFGKKQKPIQVKNKTLEGLFHFPFRFEHTKKNISHKNHLSPQKVLHPQDIVDAVIFCAKLGFCVKCFFLYIRNEKKTVQSPLFLGSSPMSVLVPPPKKIYSWGRTLGGFVMKNSQQFDDVPIFILSIYFSWTMIKKK